MNPSRKLPLLLGVLLSGTCWYLAFDLSLHAWWALWLAPVPVLVGAMQVKGFQAFGIAFAAFLIGRLSWWPYLHSVLPLAPAILFTIGFPLVFGLIILAARKIIPKVSPAVGVFVYPVVWTAFEFLQFLFSRDGTIASIAYTQCDFLPLVQVASITGVLGMTFLVSWISSVAALSWYYHSQGVKVRKPIGIALLVLGVVLSYGLIRLYAAQPQEEAGKSAPQGAPNPIKVGLAAIPMKPEGSLVSRYLQEVRALAGQGATVVLLPEKGIPVPDTAEATITRLLAEEALHSRITIIAGVTRLYKDHPECQAWVVSPEGRLLLNYRKVNLFEGEVYEGFVPGKAPGFFNQHGQIAGVAICKDLDYEKYIRLYRQRGASILYVPAWDFNRDGWFHCRIAMMRAVENGYSLVRNARDGRLTISDDRGRVSAEASAEDGRRAFLTGELLPSANATLYSRWGDWFGWVNLVVAVGFLLVLFLKKRLR